MCFVLAATPPVATGQTTRQSESAPGVVAGADDLESGRRLLESVRDNVFSFDDPAFYWFCRHVARQDEKGVTATAPADQSVPWSFLLERPGDYRGNRVVIEGLLQSRIPIEISNREGVGRLFQCTLSELGTRALCTVVTIDDPAAVPLRSRVQADGYFIKVRAFSTNSGEAGAGPLLVARRLALVQAPGRGLGDWGIPSGTRAWLLAGTAFLAIVWLVLRRSTRRSARRPGAFPSRRKDAAEAHDFDWLVAPPNERPPSNASSERPRPPE